MRDSHRVLQESLDHLERELKISHRLTERLVRRYEHRLLTQRRIIAMLLAGLAVALVSAWAPMP